VTARTIDYMGSYWLASAGKRSVDLDGTPGAGGIAQTFATGSGQEYVVAFDLTGNPECPPPIKRIQVSAAGQSAVFTVDPSGKTRTAMGWEKKSWRFTANAASATLQFQSLDGAEEKCGPVIDNVSVTVPAN